MSKLTPRQTFGAARIALRGIMPYFKRAIYALTPVEKPGIGTLGVSAEGVLYWDPDFVVQVGVMGTACVLLHEVGHVLKKHHTRAEILGVKPHEQMLANICMDGEINDGLAEALRAHTDNNGNPLALPGSPVMPGEGILEDCEPNQLWEVYFKKMRAQAQGGDAGGSQGEGEDGKSAGDGAVAAGKCGGCAGHPNEWEDPKDSKRKDPERELDRLRRQVARDVKEYEKGEQKAGSVPGMWKRWADELLITPPVDWIQQTNNLIRDGVEMRRGDYDYTYARPSSRQALFGYGPGVPVLPSTFKPEPSIGVVWDTSGSMGTTEGAIVKGTLEDIILQLDVPVQLFSCDAQVHVTKKVHSLAEAIELAQGGGGTMFSPVFEKIADMPYAQRPSCLIFMTDGGNFDKCPVEPPAGVTVIWLLVGMRETPKFEGRPWGHFIEVPREIDRQAV